MEHADDEIGPNTKERMADRPPIDGADLDAIPAALDDTAPDPSGEPAIDDV